MGELENHGIDVVVCDPLVEDTVLDQLGLKVAQEPFSADGVYGAVILAVGHKAFQEKPIEDYKKLLRDKDGPGVLVDVKGVLSEAIRQTRSVYWNL